MKVDNQKTGQGGEAPHYGVHQFMSNSDIAHGYATLARWNGEHPLIYLRMAKEIEGCPVVISHLFTRTGNLDSLRAPQLGQPSKDLVLLLLQKGLEHARDEVQSKGIRPREVPESLVRDYAYFVG